MNFKDHFTKQAKEYAKYRPDYPDELFHYLSQVSPSNKLAWDCATGSGQAANGLANYFKKIIASDASANQVQNAFNNENIIYKVFPAEKAEIESSTVDLITVAQALHWFDFNKFYSEARRVLRKKGIIAVWLYNLVEISDTIDPVIKRFDEEILKDFWPPERQLFYDEYKSIPFPFEQLSPPEFRMTANWTVENLLGFLSTWSAVQNYIEKEKSNPVDLVKSEIKNLWGNQIYKTAGWKIVLKIGKV